MATTSTLRPALAITPTPSGTLTSGTLTVKPSITAGQLDFEAGEVTWVYQEEFTIAASGTKEIDLYDFAGGVTPTGDTIAAASVKTFFLYLEPGDSTDGVSVGPAVSNGWDQLVGASGLITLEGNTTKGALFQIQSVAGLSVTDASDHLLTLTNLSGSETASLQLIVAGA